MFYNSFQLHAEEVISTGKLYKLEKAVIKIGYITEYVKTTHLCSIPNFQSHDGHQLKIVFRFDKL